MSDDLCQLQASCYDTSFILRGEKRLVNLFDMRKSFGKHIMCEASVFIVKHAILTSKLLGVTLDSLISFIRFRKASASCVKSWKLEIQFSERAG